MKMLDGTRFLSHFNQEGEDMVKRKEATGVRNEVPTKEGLKKFKEEIVKFPGQKPRLPGNVISFTFCPLTPRSAGLAGHVPAHEFHVISEGLIDQMEPHGQSP
jgi:hypothetical protein